MNMKKKCDETPIIILDDVWKIYRMGEVEVPALRGMNMKIFPCEFAAIMGPSGSGKSTLMNMVGCLDVPTKGTVYLEDQNISELTESDLAQIRGRKIGFIFQQFNLMPSLTALENIMLPMTFQGMAALEREERAVKLLEGVDLDGRMHHRPNELSGGEQQRVAIARALANNPDVVLADEPTGNLDTKTGEEVMEMLSNLCKQEHKTIVMVTHDSDLLTYADRAIMIRDGKVEKEVKGGKKK